MSEGAIVDGQTMRPGLSQMERVVDTFVAPTKTFTDILRNRSWWLPFVLMMIASLAVAFTMQKRVGFDRMAEMSLQQNPSQQAQVDALQPEQRAGQMKIRTTITEAISYMYWVFILLGAAIGGAVLWGSFNFLAGAKTTFGEMFAVWMYASLTGLAASLIIILTLVIAGGDSFNIQDPLGTNPGYYLSAESPHWLRAFLGSFDLLTFWFLGLLILGTSIVAKVKRGVSAAVVLGWWVLILLVKTGFAAVTG